ncbi:MAG: hypothetical protein MZW92_45120 [Comamonadaceae bacterium]|nr:hypothetical protein [Comamonadaceae bacterium]
MLNAINDTSSIIGQKVNDPASMVLAVGRAQAVAQQNAAWLNYGKVAEQALPVFRNVIEADHLRPLPAAGAAAPADQRARDHDGASRATPRS